MVEFVMDQEITVQPPVNLEGNQREFWLDRYFQALAEGRSDNEARAEADRATDQQMAFVEYEQQNQDDINRG